MFRWRQACNLENRAILITFAGSMACILPFWGVGHADSAVTPMLLQFPYLGPFAGYLVESRRQQLVSTSSCTLYSQAHGPTECAVGISGSPSAWCDQAESACSVCRHTMWSCADCPNPLAPAFSTCSHICRSWWMLRHRCPALSLALANVTLPPWQGGRHTQVHGQSLHGRPAMSSFNKVGMSCRMLA